jgi:hypothetical protein
VSTSYFRINTDVTLGELLRLAADGPAVIHTYYAGEQAGLRVVEKEVLRSDEVLVSENGGLTTAGIIRKSAGMGRVD